MIFSKRGTFCHVSRVTGPTHNSLDIELTTGSQKAQPQVEALAGFCNGHGKLDPAAIVSAVLEGLALANGTYDMEYAAARIRYYTGDNPPEEIYGVLAFRVIERLIEGGAFLTEEPENGQQTGSAAA